MCLLAFHSTFILLAQSTAAMHQSWNEVLQKHVDKQGIVDYNGIKNNTSFHRYTGMLKKVKGADGYAEKDAMAYWINVYNTFVIKLIIDNNETASIKNIPNAFEEKFISLPSGRYSLNDIENNILRNTYKDARIHFVLVCGAVSCPPLHDEAITDQNLDKKLDQLTKAFITNPKFNQITENHLKISELFKWYETDFGAAGGVRAFVKKHSGINVSKTATIEYLPYNWDLNSKKL